MNSTNFVWAKHAKDQRSVVDFADLGRFCKRKKLLPLSEVFSRKDIRHGSRVIADAKLDKVDPSAVMSLVKNELYFSWGRAPRIMPLG